MSALTATERDMIRLVKEPGFQRWMEQIHFTGGCAAPVYLSGRTTTRDAATGEVLGCYDTSNEPGGRLAVRCRNRRESRCAPCSRLHSGDTFHLVRAGLLGGKGTSSRVADHPRLFVTLTPPSFGAVHRACSGTDRCHPRRNGGRCEHGRSLRCGQAHSADAPAVGQPLCRDCYDYSAHCLWNAHTGELWNRTTITIRRHVATAAGITQTELNRHLRVSFAKVAEYQRRGAIHFHAVIRLDGPNGPNGSPPDWATTELLEDAVRTACGAVTVRMPYVPGLGEHAFRWGEQLDVHPVRSFGDDSPVTDQAVAAYVAKYVSKSVGDCGGTDRRVTSLDDIALLPVAAHLRTLMITCWRLGRLAELNHLRLRAWAHAFGFRGHVLTKSRRYSTTYGALRSARAQHFGFLPPDNGTTATEAAWRYVGSGHTLAEAEIAAGIAADLAELAEIRRDLVRHGGPPYD
ncbi:plasmid replication initiator protein [Streptomyces sp. SID13588]|nr:plasmid replication initiator protein [Streptomyces sp. SID13588]